MTKLHIFAQDIWAQNIFLVFTHLIHTFPSIYQPACLVFLLSLCPYHIFPLSIYPLNLFYPIHCTYLSNICQLYDQTTFFCSKYLGTEHISSISTSHTHISIYLSAIMSRFSLISLSPDLIF